MSLVKRIERAGRRLVVFVLALVLRRRRRAVVLPARPRILVVRLDERVGNLLLLTPLLSTLRARYPDATIELLGSVKGERMIADHAALDRFIPFRKKALLASDGPLRTPLGLRRRRYHLALDAANPTDPSTTQVIIVRLCGARHSIGADHDAFGRLFTAPASVAAAGPHEIDLRLALLGPLGDGPTVRDVSLTPPPLPDTLRAALGDEPFVVVNVGARLAEKTLTAERYRALCDVVTRAGRRVVITWGPKERALAEAVAEGRDDARLAPPTDLVELAAVLGAATRVITVDTGPMHLAVAVGTPTCGLFVDTEPERYGYAEPPHTLVDVRQRFDDEAVERIGEWLRE